ncbi:hypothetical protein COCON_G00039380 [Conger conger]|uniref:CUB domain-containing protein n=1 Tax=Conger conger TaxID=82655 RepID=A0A9Q1I835_CONCO|nr:hypothetical protein COCON_G00039380 [Conger conger]
MSRCVSRVALIGLLRKGWLRLAELNYTDNSLEFSLADGLNNIIKLKMSQKNFLLAITSTFVLICSIITANSEIPVKATDAAYNSPAPGRSSRAFLRLRSCHRVLRGESGDFFSPDFLCSNPPLWCNWTVAAPAGSRIRLHLQDYTPAEACHLKRDQVHLDEAPGSGRHRTLERCWGDAVYTSDSSVLHVVLLIDAGLEPTYRGFHARYHTFGLPQTPAPAPAPAPTPGNNLHWAGGAGEDPEAEDLRVTEEGPPQPERGPEDPRVGGPEDPRVEGPSDDPGVSNRPANDGPSNQIPAEAAREEGPPVQAPPPPDATSPAPAADPPAKTPPESREPEPDENNASEPGSQSTRKPREDGGEEGRGRGGVPDDPVLTASTPTSRPPQAPQCCERKLMWSGGSGTAAQSHPYLERSCSR